MKDRALVALSIRDNVTKFLVLTILNAWKGLIMMTRGEINDIRKDALDKMKYFYDRCHSAENIEIAANYAAIVSACNSEL